MTETKTDYERFKEMLDSVGQKYELSETDQNKFIQINGCHSENYAWIEFTKEGKFVEIGLW